MHYVITYNISFFRVCPIFQVSNVSGYNLNLLKSFLSLLSARMRSHEDKPAEFQIDETYSVPVSAHPHTLTDTACTHYQEYIHCSSNQYCLIFSKLIFNQLYAPFIIIVCMKYLNFDTDNILILSIVWPNLLTSSTSALA